MALDEKIIVYTDNLARELLKISSQTHISLNELDFNILAFSTQYRFADLKWTKISEKELILFEQDTIFLKSDLQIIQKYKIEIFHNINVNQISKAVKLIANRNLTKIIAQIDFKNLDFHDKLALELLQTIYKKMLKLKFLIGIRTFNFKKDLISFCNQHKNKPLNQTIQLTVAQGIEPILSQDESLILVYKEKTQNYSIDEKRSGIISVDENEVVLKHMQFKEGKEGKDLNLHTIEVLSGNENKVNFSCSKAFKEIKQDGYIEYLALKKGYIVQDGDKFDIANELEFNGVDFKSIGILKAGIDKNVKINIKLSSEIKDAVNSGVGIECEELNIIGNVASNTQLHAKIIKIEGATHSKAKIQSEQAYIKTHRGFVQGQSVNVDLLEGGTIKAKEVKIKKSLGGNIQADKIYIENLESNNSCIFFENTTIEHINGENNKFHAKIKVEDKDYDQELSNLEETISKLNLKINTIKQYILSSQNGITNIEKKIEELKNQGQNVPVQYTKILKNFSLQNMQLNKLQNKEKELLEYKKSLILELTQLQKLLFKANVINKSGKWTNTNEIKFSLLTPKEDFSYSSSINENAKYIGIEKIIQNNQENIKINKKSDYEQKDIAWLSPSKE
ncbi:DUF342 domain-containing protein [Campylobacter hepaticus]|uniref:flagellar assembly protein A n=1 Tax=Campylobacter hepaticus TaxID=1813019 RepID=UPI0029A613A6|nr:flagellar assembly protein A [Campylobacter hepaticus]MDX2323290.1 DUF342 domain-containing protein [Campylobacter hepaticus]MDX2332550.1 DUF342 domain-containing protein [Campylobacter hepaticus]MDX2409539.1 DUF342 domain-containing protein [Campylobacter hepaticus]